MATQYFFSSPQWKGKQLILFFLGTMCHAPLVSSLLEYLKLVWSVSPQKWKFLELWSYALLPSGLLKICLHLRNAQTVTDFPKYDTVSQWKFYHCWRLPLGCTLTHPTISFVFSASVKHCWFSHLLIHGTHHKLFL